jgi:plasmid stabilization system protein ParE
MAKQIVWTHTAQIERKEILEYWIKRNKTKNFSIKLNKLFISALKDVSKNPFIGRKTDVQNVRAKIVRDYLLFYEVTPDYIYVLSVWDTRRDSSSRLFK